MKKKLFLLFVPLFFLGLISSSVSADTIVDATGYAWGENIGWINFGADGGNVIITNTRLTGSIWSSNYGWINLSPTNGGVTNTCDGILGGNAWSSSLGWISFSGVKISANGKFIGIAGSSDIPAGRINFDCSECNVTTDWRYCPQDIIAVDTPIVSYVNPVSYPSEEGEQNNQNENLITHNVSLEEDILSEFENYEFLYCLIPIVFFGILLISFFIFKRKKSRKPI